MTNTPTDHTNANSELAQLYPPVEPFKSGMLDVGDGHQVYWELCGNHYFMNKGLEKILRQAVCVRAD